MILDKLLQFDPSTALASTIVTAGVASTNILDLLNGRDLGIGDGVNLEAVFTIGTVFAASGGAASLTIAIQGAPDSSGSPGTYKTLVQSGAIAKASLTAAAVIRVPLATQAGNLELTSLPRFLRCFYTATTNDFTSGTFECDLVINPQANNPPTYPAGFTVAN